MLTKLRIVPIVVLLLAPIASAFQEPVSPAVQETASWHTFNSPEGKFSVVVPAEPKAEMQEADSVVGKLKLYSYATSTKAAYLMVSYSDYPNDPVDAAQAEKVLDGVREGVLKSMGGDVISSGKVVLKGRAASGEIVDYPGREFTGKILQQGSEMYFSWKTYLVGRRLYQLAVITSKANATTPDGPKFLTSFQLTN